MSRDRRGTQKRPSSVTCLTYALRFAPSEASYLCALRFVVVKCTEMDAGQRPGLLHSVEQPPGRVLSQAEAATVVSLLLKWPEHPGPYTPLGTPTCPHRRRMQGRESGRRGAPLYSLEHSSDICAARIIHFEVLIICIVRRLTS